MRRRLFVVIFQAETPAGRGFDVALLGLILLSVFAEMLESVEGHALDARFCKLCGAGL